MRTPLTDQRIQEVYSGTSNDLNSIYKKRRVTGFFQKIMWLAFGVYIIGITVSLFSYFFSFDLGIITDYIKSLESTPENPYKNMYPFIGLFVVLYISTFLFTFLFKRYKTLETKTITKMIKGLFPHAEFTLASQIPTNQVKESQLFPWVNSETPVQTFGQMRSVIDGVKIQVADIGFIEQNVGNKIINILLKIPFLNVLVILYQYVLKNIFTSKSADNIHYTFRGMYSWTSFNKPLKGNTVVVPNTLASKADRLASFKFKEEEKIKLEDVRFTKHFSTYGSDQIEARYVLTPRMMEKIVTLRERFGRDIMLSFKNNKLFVAVENPNGLFSFPSGKLDSIQIIEEIVNEINAVESIVEEFELNRKN